MTGEMVAHAGCHDGQCLGGGKHMAMTFARMIGMTMGNNCPVHSAYRVDIKITQGAIEPGGCWVQKLFYSFDHR